MTDKELLEWAAKAAGLIELAKNDLDMQKYLSRWNPLEDDGDAFRLMVSLRLCVAIEFDRIDAITQHECATEYLYDKPQTDYYAATRRAIVRAAAAIGREMKP